MLLQFGKYELDDARRLLHRAGTRMTPEPRVFDLLLYLIRNRERAVPRVEILRNVWAGVAVDGSVLSVALRKLRQTLADETGACPWVETVHGFGLRFQGAVTSSAPEARGGVTLVRSNSPAPAPRETTAGQPGLTVVAPRRLAGAAWDPTLLTCEELLLQLHQYGVLPTLDADLVSVRSCGLLESARGARVRYVMRAHAGRCGDGFEAHARLTDRATLRVVWARRVEVVESDPALAARRLSAQIAASLWTGFMLGRVEVDAPGNAQDAWTQGCAGWRQYWSETWEGMQGSLGCFEAALRADDASPWARVGRSLASFTRHYFDPAQTQLLAAAKRDVGAVLESDPDSLLAQTYHAIYLQAEGKTEVARGALERAQRQAPDLSWIACNLGDLDLLQDPARAVGTYEDALRLDVGGELHPRIWTGLATAKRLVGEFEGALEAAESAIQAKPGVPYGYIQAAAAWGALGSKPRGRELLRRLRTHAPTLAPGVVRAHVRLKEARRSSYADETLPCLRAAGWSELC